MISIEQLVFILEDYHPTPFFFFLPHPFFYHFLVFASENTKKDLKKLGRKWQEERDFFFLPNVNGRVWSQERQNFRLRESRYEGPLPSQMPFLSARCGGSQF
eukprot:TRINITY_DN11562_c1_g1_i7.p1 TRINITY_DN11562_c1_g1~~TRINITY_DN11562_c1_g1_i7.p1  ORF type:complete len:102 (+),score=5.85 TRINITY_DN11562_c1_g1_i7:379-684(+)